MNARRPVLIAALVLLGLLIPTAGAAARPFAACRSLTRACLLPFPNDLFTVRDSRTPTGRRLRLPASVMPKNVQGQRITPGEYNRADGFSPGSAIIVRVPGLDTPAAFRRNHFVPLTDLRHAYDRRQRVLLIDARTHRRQLIWAELDRQATKPSERTLLIHPAKNLAEGHRFIVVLRDLVGANGRRLNAHVRAGTYRTARYRSIFRTLGRLKIARRSLYLTWDFTVASRRDRTQRLLHIRDDAFARLGDRNLADGKVAGRSPTFTVTNVVFNPQDDPRMFKEVFGTITVPCYLDRAGCPPGAKFHYSSRNPDALPTAMPGNVHRTEFVCMIPKAALTKPARISLYGHGLLGRPTEIEAGNVRDMAAEHDFVFCATPWSGFASEDVGNAIMTLSNLDRFPRFIDRHQQGELNALYLGRAMLHPKGFAANDAFKGLIDTSHLYYDGNSQGGILGGALAAVAPDYTRAVLGVPGMDFGGLLLLRSTDFATYSAILDPAYPDPSVRPVLLDIIQQLWDRSEADGYAAQMTDHPLPGTPRHRILMHVAYGDHQVSQYAAAVEARTIGAFAHCPVVGPSRARDRNLGYGIPCIRSYPFGGSGWVVWDSGPGLVDPPPTVDLAPSTGEDPHEHVRSTPAARTQKSRFLSPRSGIIDVCHGIECRTSVFTP